MVPNFNEAEYFDDFPDEYIEEDIVDQKQIEDFVTNPEQVLSKIFKFLRLPLPKNFMEIIPPIMMGISERRLSSRFVCHVLRPLK